MSDNQSAATHRDSAPGKDYLVELALLASTFVIAVCGLVYELLAGTISSYLLGDSVYQFSIVIGLFMAAMGLGSYLSRFIRERPEQAFVHIQVAIAVIGGGSALALFAAFSYLDNYETVLFLLLVLIGALVGIEIPLVIRILKAHRILRLNVSNVLTVDYLGALAAALLFPLVLVPSLGLVQTALLFGFLNLVVAAMGAYLFRRLLRNPKTDIALLVVVLALLATAALSTARLESAFTASVYSGEVIYSARTPYQHVVVTRDGNMIKLFINGALQFNSLDEYRYHESLVHPAMAMAGRHDRILLLGGGDGMALREVLKYPDAHEVTLVDLDPEITRIFRDNPLLARLNGGVLNDPRVTVVNDDAGKYLKREGGLYDVIIVDLPDPHDIQLSRLYSRAFYQLLANRLTVTGVMVTQATSPMFAREAFWSIAHTVAAARTSVTREAAMQILPAHVYVPSFGEWGFVFASQRKLVAPDQISVPTRFLNAASLKGLWEFPPDMDEVETEINTVYTHRLVDYYETGWSTWFRAN